MGITTYHLKMSYYCMSLLFNIQIFRISFQLGILFDLVFLSLHVKLANGKALTSGNVFKIFGKYINMNIKTYKKIFHVLLDLN